MSDHLMQTYARLPVSFVRGEGAKIWDTEGREYLDALGGIAVCALGHAHPRVADAVSEQARTLVHTSNLYGIEPQSRLADRLAALSGMSRVFFGNSGAEANEAAIKIARLFGHRKGVDQPAIIVMEGSFHGRTLATLTATGNRKVQAGFEPLVSGFVRVPYGDVEAVRNVAENNANVVAILVEPITGEGGIQFPPQGYLSELRDICDERDWLLMLDEIQTGMGRTGAWFAHQLEDGAKPDVMTLAKALGNGVPIGACLAGDEAAEVLAPGNHGSTFGGNPLACAAANAVIDVIEENGLVERAAQLGERIRGGLETAVGSLEGVREIRGAGLMIGIELAGECPSLVKEALDKGLLINVTAGNVIRLLPPYILSDEEADRIVEILAGLIADFLAREPQDA